MISYIQNKRGVSDIMTENYTFTSQNNLYFHFEKQSKSRVNRKCIDGTVTGCGNCVGYCRYREHPGFLTKEMRKEHDCIKKQCYHYLPKPQQTKSEKRQDLSTVLFNLAKRLSAGMDDFRIINISETDSGWTIGYITVFGQQDFSDMERAIKKASGVQVVMRKLDYSFDRCVELICGA